MKTAILCLVLVSAVSCTTLLKNPPANADINYIYENNKLVEVEIDYRNDLRPIVKSAAQPVATLKNVIPIAVPAAPVPTLKKSGATKTYYKVDDGQLERVKPTHIGYSVLPEAPIVKSIPAAPVAPVAAVKKSGATKTYYKIDDGELEKVKPTHVGYSVLPDAPAAPVVKSAPVAPVPVPAAPVPAPVATVKAASEPIRITGPQVVLKQAPAPTARSVIIEGPKVIYKRTGPAPVAAPAPAPAPAPVVMVKSAPATPAPAPASPLIKTFWKQDDGELEKITPTHVSYSLVKSAPSPVPVAAPVPVVPVAAPAPVIYSLPTPVPVGPPSMPSVMVEDESIEDEED